MLNMAMCRIVLQVIVKGRAGDWSALTPRSSLAKCPRCVSYHDLTALKLFRPPVSSNSYLAEPACRCYAAPPIASFTDFMAVYRGAALSDVHVDNSKAHLGLQGGSGFVP